MDETILYEGKSWIQNKISRIRICYINEIYISNVMGQKIYETSVNDDQVVVDVNDFPSGIYMIRVVTDEYEVTKRITVSH